MSTAYVHRPRATLPTQFSLSPLAGLSYVHCYETRECGCCLRQDSRYQQQQQKLCVTAGSKRPIRRTRTSRQQHALLQATTTCHLRRFRAVFSRFARRCTYFSRAHRAPSFHDNPLVRLVLCLQRRPLEHIGAVLLLSCAERGQTEYPQSGNLSYAALRYNTASMVSQSLDRKTQGKMPTKIPHRAPTPSPLSKVPKYVPSPAAKRLGLPFPSERQSPGSSPLAEPVSRTFSICLVQTDAY
jgi:hypothetical protein